MKLTPWFSGDQKPVRVGVYLRDYGDGVFWCYWNGIDWCVGSIFADKAMFCTDCITLFQNLPWRGVMK